MALAVTNSSVNIGNRIRGDDGLRMVKACLMVCRVLLENCLHIVAYASIRLRLAYPNNTGLLKMSSKLGPKLGCRDPAALPCSPDAGSRII